MNIYTDNNKIIYKFDDKDDYEALLIIFKNLRKPAYNSDLKDTLDNLYNIISNRYDEKDNTIIFNIDEICDMLHLFNFCSAVLLLDNKDLVNEIQYLHYCDTYNTEIIEYYQYILKSLKPVMFLILFTAVINLFFTGGDDVVFEFSFLKVTKSGLYSALFMALRVIILVTATSLLTYTTSPILLTDGIEKLLEPFSKIGVPAHELAMMMTIALRFIPTLLEETDKIIMAQKARGADFESGNFVRRAKSLIPILVPLFISSFRRADELATAMECRCYRGGKNRTRLRELRFTRLDAYAAIQMCMFMIILIVMGVFKI